ncbi:MAG: NAD(P)/FAD-dependent oxidoreductase [Verrucomicrobia bacterium]|nr:NAD(P)/FAD-dependent oxidoreductase [Verrucomicrobiota bacterium]
MIAHDEYDAILLGAGHNSLILQAYLARAGLTTLCLEPRDLAGGGLATIEQPPGSGFFHNTHSFYHRGITHMPWYADLELKRYGAEYIEPDLNVALIASDGRVLEWWTDFEKTVASVAQFSRKDAGTVQHWCHRFRPIVTNILIPEAQAPPVPFDQRRSLLSQSAEGRLLLEVSALSPLEFVLREFEHPIVQAGLLFFNGLREVDLRCRGFGHHIPALLASGRMAQMCIGGSRKLAEALVAAIQNAGGNVHVNVKPRRILIQSDRVIGVETADGEVIRARQFVASGLNPHQTFLELIDESLPPSDWLTKVRNFQYNLLAPLFALNVNLREPPRYSAAQKHPELERAFMVILGLDRPEQFEEIVKHHEAGAFPPTVMWGSCPTIFDSSQAPRDRHAAFMWEKLPYRLQGDPKRWDAVKHEHGKAMLSHWQKFAPNIGDALIEEFTASPLDVERTLPNMRFGDLLVGAFNHGQVGYHRPFPGAGHYRGHFKGLYLCGGSCHPGGNITGLPGYNCAQVILADLGLK